VAKIKITAKSTHPKSTNVRGKTTPRLVKATSNDVYNLLDIKLGVKAVSDFDYIKLGQTGITKRSIDNLAQHIGMSRKNVAEQIFDISVKTLERKTSTEKLDKKISSHAVEIAKVLQHANEVFGDEEKVRQWINTKNAALNNNTPVSFFDTLTGMNMVNDILTRIEEGVYS
jgi:putative toxin-antitoxin system antitoxin component (TIGR02293 family)